MEAFKYTDAGKLGRIEHILLYEGLIVLCKAGVQASMSFNTIYEAWVALADDGDIKFGACTCKAGRGETCSHLSAILHEIERQHRLGINSATPTDLPQKWSEVKGRQVEPASHWPSIGIQQLRSSHLSKLKCQSLTSRNSWMPAF